ncbi:MAG: hypothetical protein HYX32_14580 [Actinobacteria bacterium]|nr:hypothetical protein [Actinomycetota bacterium]
MVRATSAKNAAVSTSRHGRVVVKATMRELYGVDVEDPATIERHADTVVELFFNGILVAPAGVDASDECVASPAGRGMA